MSTPGGAKGMRHPVYILLGVQIMLSYYTPIIRMKEFMMHSSFKPDG